MDYKFGHFSDDFREFIITNPHTPRKWKNYIGNELYGLSIAQDGTGASMCYPPDGYDVTYPGDSIQSGRYIYIKDLASGRIWSVTHEPCRAKFKNYEAQYGLGYAAFKSEFQNIEATYTLFVPLDKQYENWQVKLTNKSNKIRKLRIATYVEWYLAGFLNPWDGYIWHAYARFNAKNNAIVATLNDLHQPSRTLNGFLIGSEKPVGYHCRKADFLGADGNYARPQALVDDNINGRGADVDDYVGVLFYDVELKPGEEKELSFALGFSEGNTRPIPRIKKSLASGADTKDYAKVIAFWDKVVKTNTVTTPDETFNARMNIWLKYQVYQCYLWTRRGGARGVRDVSQDTMAAIPLIPDKIRERIIEIFRYQYKSGLALRQYRRFSDKHDERKFMDNAIWGIYLLTDYIKQSGDYSILDAVVPYHDGGEGPIMEHAKAIVDFLWKSRGSHGLILVKGGDWNDALDHLGHGGRGESVLLSEYAYYAVFLMKELMLQLGKKAQANKYSTMMRTLKRAINTNAWGGSWYIRGYDDTGKAIGTSRNKEGKIYLTPQVWSVISGVADEARAVKSLESVEKRADTPYGPLMLWPAYTKFDPSIGRLSVLRPGIFENGGAYCQPVAWKVVADLMLGRTAQAQEELWKILPENPKADIAHTGIEPHALTNCFLGPAAEEKYGKTLSGWFTGTVDYIYKGLWEWMIGIEPHYDGFYVKPNLFPKWKHVEATRKLRGATYEVNIKRQGRKKTAKTQVRTITVDGNAVKGNFVPYFADGKKHRIEVELAPAT